MTETQIKKAIDTLVVLVDTREKLPNHITNCFDLYGVKWERRKLKSGDYSCYLPENKELGIKEIQLENMICIERKMSCDEIIQCLTTQKERFNREFTRSEALIPLLIEDKFKNAVTQNYRSKVTSKQFLGSLFSFCDRHNTYFYFMEDNQFSALWIYNIFKYHIRNILKNI